MKTYTITILLFWINQINAQQALDTIYANDTKNVALFFPEPIRQGITGADNFVFTYNREKEQYFGLLQAKPGKESNLLVLNKNGNIFSYIIRYKEKLSKLNYFVPRLSSIGNEKPIIIDSIITETSVNSLDLEKEYYKQFSIFLLDRKQGVKRIKKQQEGIFLSVENIVFDKEELYFVIQIKNNSTLDFDVNFLNLSIETRQKGKRKSLQRLYQEPIFKSDLPSKIIAHETNRFVFVMSKFSLSNNRRVLLELNEKNGERNVELKVAHRFINNPE
tara:strand:- start:12510 stop:13334 length:825 start_codon:yes stop_codon:yes gene_type:complete